MQGRRVISLQVHPGRLCDRNSTSSVVSQLPGAASDIDIPFIQPILAENLLPSATNRSLSGSIVSKSMARGLVKFRHA